MEAGYDPTCVLGGEMAPLGGSNARVGGSLTVVEACEAYNSFIQLTPEAAVVTNIEVDHLDFHGTPEHLFDSFARFLGQVRDFAVVNGDDARLRGLADRAPRVVTYGADAGNTYRFAEVALGAEPSFALWRGNARLGTVRLRVPGLHNISNAVGAAALALELGAPMDAVTRALGAFPGMRRRFERLGTCGGVAVVDDYAHHPTEIRATLEAARAAFPGRVVAVFQPHLFSRTRDLLDDFAGALALADVALVLPIYAAREAPIAGVDHTQLVARIRALAPDRAVAGLGGHEEAVALLAHAAGRGVAPAHAHAMRPLSEGDVIFTIGAGDVDRVGHALVAGDFFDGTPST
jgi:UDP-N-acetylmuramate--alanine ligase